MKSKNNLQLLFAGCFFGFSVLDIVGLVWDIQWLQILSKPLLMTSLLALYLASTKNKNIWYITALLFSLLGDVFLLDKSNMFLLGVGSFLMTQLLYIKIFGKELPKHSKSKWIGAIVPFAIYLIVLMKLVSPALGSMFLPVLVYGITISVFGVVALLNYILRKDQSSMVLLLGAFLFIVSDSMIALNKFYEPLFIYPVAIMLTYILAQYLIYRYVISTENHSVR